MQKILISKVREKIFQRNYLNLNKISLNFCENRFIDLGLSTSSIKIIENNNRIKENLQSILETSKINKCDKKMGNLIFAFATKICPSTEFSKEKLAEYIKLEKIKNSSQLDTVLSYIKQNMQKKGNIDWIDLEKDCGLLKNFSIDQIENFIEEFIQNNWEEIKSLDNNTLKSCLKKIRSSLSDNNGHYIFQIFNKKIQEIKKSQQNVYKNSFFFMRISPFLNNINVLKY